MRYVKWMFVIVCFAILTSFVGKDKPVSGLNVGDSAPDFCIPFMSTSKQIMDLSDLRGKYVLISFWASYDAESRMLNNALYHALAQKTRNNWAMVSVSFDEYQSVFKETIRMDGVAMPTCFVETDGEQSALFKKYRLKTGFGNYLLNSEGVIVAKNISASELPLYLK